MSDDKPERKKEVRPFPRDTCRRCGMRSVATMFKDGKCLNEVACNRRVVQQKREKRNG